ncbi:MAG: MotA/TolQ/ExbB proton channel family protein [Spirochaetaceae bacterium]|nr:MotA/TolQ/ExbB proton channel family protein [Spirochaetaceae bacterium]
MIEIIKSGGFLMIPIFICGIYATYMIFERIFFFASLKRKDDVLAKNLAVTIESRDFDQAISHCVESATPYALMVKKALEFRAYKDDDIREAVENESRRIMPLLEKQIQPLGMIASVATLLGLLGTVVGNIEAFAVIGESYSALNPPLIAAAISKSLVTTATGIIVAIPASIFHGVFKAKANEKITEIESAVTDIILKLSGRDSMYEI